MDGGVAVHDAGLVVEAGVDLREAGQRPTSARIRKGSTVSLGCSARFVAFRCVAQRLQLGDVDLLDVGEVRDAALGVLHLLGDLAAQADHLDLLDPVACGEARAPAPPACVAGGEMASRSAW